MITERTSLSNCKNWSWFWPIICANWGFPSATCCRIGSSIAGCCWTSCLKCWKCGLLRRKSMLTGAACPPGAAVVAADLVPAPPRAPPCPCPACAAASKRFTGSSAPSSAAGGLVRGFAPVVAGGGEVGAPAPREAPPCLCSAWTLAGIPFNKYSIALSGLKKAARIAWSICDLSNPMASI